MARYDLVADLHECVNTLEQRLGALRTSIEQQPLLVARVFSLPAIEKGHEHDEIDKIAVTQHLGSARALSVSDKALLYHGYSAG
ncbi:hypothetical protein CRX72_17160 [Pantoea sp. BRM17]|nr:hypothetical protein CRX72_17160 [Pantoea sp. BRM17]